MERELYTFMKTKSFILGLLLASPLMVSAQTTWFPASSAGTTYLKPAVATWGVWVPQLGGTGTRCLQVNNAGILAVASGACGSGGGGSGSSPFATTTSTVSGQNIIYALNNTDILTIGNTATTSAPFFFDPNALFARIGGQLLVVGSTTLQNFTAQKGILNIASTTLFSSTIASTSQLTVSGQADGCASFGNSGRLTSTGSACGSGSGSFPWPFTKQNSGSQATTTVMEWIGGFMSDASSTLTTFTYTNATGTNLALTSLSPNSLVASNSLGGLVSTSTIGNNQLQNSTIALTDSGSTLTIGGSPSALGGTLTATLNLAHSNVWSALQTFANATATNFSATIASTSQFTLSGAADGCAQFSASGRLSSTGSACGSGGGSSNSKWATTTVADQGIYPNSPVVVGIGTSTPDQDLAVLQLASSTKPQLALIYGAAVPSFAFNNVGGTLVLATTSPTTYATSTYPAFVVSSNGPIGIGTLTPQAVNGNARLTVAASGSVDIIASTTDNTTASAAILEAYADGGRVVLGSHASAQVVSRYGLTLGGWGELSQFTNGSASNGIVIGTQTAVPLVFGTNNVELGRFTTTGLQIVGSTTLQKFTSTEGTTTNFAVSSITANRLVKTSAGGGGALVGSSATGTLNIFNNSTMPDATSSLSWIEPYSISAVNDNFQHLIFVASSTATSTGFYGSFTVPFDYNSNPLICFIWTAPITIGNQVTGFAYRDVTGNNSASLDQTTFQESLVSGSLAAPSSVNNRMKNCLTLTAANLLAGDTVEYFFTRQGANASDTMASGVIYFEVDLEYLK